MASQPQKRSAPTSKSHDANAKNNDLVAFESELPESLLAALNETYQNTKLRNELVPSMVSDQVLDRPVETKVEPERALPRSWTRSIWLLILPVTVLCCSLIYLVQPPQIRDPLLYSKNPNAVLKNLARRSQGAYIIEGYTSPPASLSWWPLGPKFKTDPECIIRSSVHECWPFRGETAIGIGLEAPSQIFSINANMSFTTTSDHSKEAHLVRDVSVFSVDEDGSIYKVGQSAHNSTEVHLTPGKLTCRILITRVRILLLGKPWGQALGCLHNIAIMGVASEDEVEASLTKLPEPAKPMVLSLD